MVLCGKMLRPYVRYYSGRLARVVNELMIAIDQAGRQ